MNHLLLENLLVALIVIAAIAYAAWRYTPSPLKEKLAHFLGTSPAQAEKLSHAGGCGSCSSCKACATPAEKNGHALHLYK